MGLVRIAAIGAARRDDAKRQRGVLHGAHLHRRGVGAQQLPLAVGAGREVEGVVLLAGRVLGRNVERREVVEVVLDVGAFGDGEAHVAEDRDDLVQHLADRVDTALQRRPDGKRDIDALVGEPRLDGGLG